MDNLTIDVRTRVCEILRTQQCTLRSSMERSGVDTNAVDVTRLDIANSMNDIANSDYLHVLEHMLTSAQNGGINELIDVPEVIIPLISIRNVLLDVGMGPIEIDTNNRTYKHCLDRPTNWIVISYTQQKQVDIIELTHSKDCKCQYDLKTNNLPMQYDIYDELKALYDSVSPCLPLMVWWDKLVGRLSVECNKVWPALANLHYVSQKVLSIIPKMHENNNIEMDMQQMCMYNRCWPRVERACGYASEGVHMALQSSLILCEHTIRAGFLLAFIRTHVRTGNKDIDGELQGFSHTQQYDRYSSILKPLFNIAKKVEQIYKFKENYTENNVLILLQRIEQQFTNAASQLNTVHTIKPTSKYNKSYFISMAEKQLKNLDYCSFSIEAIAPELEEVATSVLVYINNDPLKERRKADTTGPRVVDTWAMRSLSHVVMSSSAAWAEAYNDGDKLVAAIVFSNIRQAIKCAENWATKVSVCKTEIHPFKPLMHTSRPIWNTTGYSGPCGVIDIECNKCKTLDDNCKELNDKLSWPGWWMSMCPKGTVAKAMTILGSTEKETEDWYLEQQTKALKSLAGVGVLHLDYLNSGQIPVVKEYDVIIMSNTNVMTLIGGMSVHSSSYDLMAVILRHTINITHACGIMMLKATEPDGGTVEIEYPDNCNHNMGTLYIANMEYDVGFLHGPCSHVSVRKAKLCAKFGKKDNLGCSNRLMDIIRGKTRVW